MTEEKVSKILEETGGDYYYADVFLRSMSGSAASKGAKISKKLFNIFHEELQKHKENRERRIEEKLKFKNEYKRTMGTVGTMGTNCKLSDANKIIHN